MNSKNRTSRDKWKVKLTEDQAALLVEIGRGRSSFNNKDFSEAAVTAFLDLIDDVLNLRALGYLEILDLHQEFTSGKRNLDHVLVRTTPAGQEWLARNASIN